MRSASSEKMTASASKPMRIGSTGSGLAGLPLPRISPAATPAALAAERRLLTPTETNRRRTRANRRDGRAAGKGRVLDVEAVVLDRVEHSQAGLRTVVRRDHDLRDPLGHRLLVEIEDGANQREPGAGPRAPRRPGPLGTECMRRALRSRKRGWPPQDRTGRREDTPTTRTRERSVGMQIGYAGCDSLPVTRPAARTTDTAPPCAPPGRWSPAAGWPSAGRRRPPASARRRG